MRSLNNNVKIGSTATMKITALTFGLLGLGFLASAAPAQAGRGGSPEAIARAINSGSVVSIEAQLERSEHLVCSRCVKLVKPLIDHEDYRVRKVAAWWLVRRGLRGDMFVKMANRLAQPDSTLARNAADVLGEMRAFKSIAPLGAALNNPVFNPEARASMARALGSIGEMEGLSGLTQALSANDAAVRAAALDGIRSLRGFQDASVAVPLLSDANADVRIAAIYTLAAPRSQTLSAMSPGAADDATRGLARLVGQDPDERVRKKAAWALGEIKANAALAGGSLRQAASDDASPLVRSLAQAALAKLTP